MSWSRYIVLGLLLGREKIVLHEIRMSKERVVVMSTTLSVYKRLRRVLLIV